MKLSIVTTLYRSEPYVAEFIDRMLRSASTISADFELIIVNDGSPDDALGVVLKLQEKDSRIVAVDLSRNFGHHQALLTGIGLAKGDFVFLIDSDLEERPELLGEFWEMLTTRGLDVVYGVQKAREGGLIRMLAGRAFYWLFNRLSSVKVPHDVMIVRLMTRTYVNALLDYQERVLYFAGLLTLVGFRQVPMVVEKPFKGETSYGIRRRVAIAVDSITSFSDRPLWGIFWFGGFISAVSAVVILVLVIQTLTIGSTVSGWLSVMVSVWLLGGIVILFLGIIGLYVSKVFLEAKQRPVSTIRQIYRAQSATRGDTAAGVTAVTGSRASG